MKLGKEESLCHTPIFTCHILNCSLLYFSWSTLHTLRNFKFEDTHVTGARNIAAAAQRAGVSRLIHFSALNASKDSPSKFLQTKVRHARTHTHYTHMHSHHAHALIPHVHSHHTHAHTTHTYPLLYASSSHHLALPPHAKALGEEAVREAFPGATIVRPADTFGHEDRFFNFYGKLRALPLGLIPLMDYGLKTQKMPIYVS